MRRFLILLTLLCLFAPSQFGQSVNTETTADDETALKKTLLLSDLQALNNRAEKLYTPVARAVAGAEIADAAWELDQTWSKKLLREAYELTLPNEEEQLKLRKRAVGASLALPAGEEVARNRVRRRVLGVAARSKSFLEELVRLGTEKLGKQEENSVYSNLAAKAVADGDTNKAGAYIIQSLESDPTVISAGFYILDAAAKDRAAADRLILQYIDVLRATPLSATNEGAFRAYYLLENIVFPSEQFIAFRQQLLKGVRPSPTQIPPASAPVIKAYVSYIVESLSALERSEPGSAIKLRGYLMSAWLPLQQYAPELTGAFMQLEKLSRRPGENSSLPQESAAETNRASYDERVKKALDSNRPDEITIGMAISRGDFDKARRMVDKLPRADRKTQLGEEINAHEAISLASKGDIYGATRLAEQLSNATLILLAYPPILKRCAVKKDQACINSLGYQAIRRLKRADTSPLAPPQGLSTPAVSGPQLDPVLSSFAKLAKAVAPVNEELGLEVLEEMIVAANNSSTDTAQGVIGFETDVFKELAPKNEGRVKQAAESLKDTLRQTVALAAIYQWKAARLTKMP
jgi:hypothetical protein